MLSVAEEYVRELNPDRRLTVFGQDYNSQTYTICGSDLMIKGHDIDNIHFGDSFTDDHFAGKRFDYPGALSMSPLFQSSMNHVLAMRFGTRSRSSRSAAWMSLGASPSGKTGANAWSFREYGLMRPWTTACVSSRGVFAP